MDVDGSIPSSGDRTIQPECCCSYMDGIDVYTFAARPGRRLFLKSVNMTKKSNHGYLLS